MRASMQRRFVITLVLALGAGLSGSGYILSKFRSYESAASKVLSGDHKAAVQGQLLEARIRAANELVDVSVTGRDADAAFRKKLEAVVEDMRKLRSEVPDKALDEALKSLAEAMGPDEEVQDDLFVQYRNIKTAAFNLYRMAWGNKWMNVARSVGAILGDLENMPYHSAQKATANVAAKLTQLIGLVTQSVLAQQDKLVLMGNIGVIRDQVLKYQDSLQKSEKYKGKRHEALFRGEGLLKRYNDGQGKSLVEFGNSRRSDLFRAMIAFALSALVLTLWFFIAIQRHSRALTRLASHVSAQMAGWITAGGNMNPQGFKTPDRPDVEFLEMYQSIDQALRKAALLRKEDLLIKRLLNIPFVLINKEKQAVFWNSPLTILARSRSVEETGPTNYLNLIRFTDAQGRVMDPVDKAINDEKETSQLALLRAGNDGIAVQAVCTPVMLGEKQLDYVMVHLRDLREENRRNEAELDRQLEIVRAAVASIRAGALPEAGNGTLIRKAVHDTVELLKGFALDLQERASVVSGQAETMGSRMAREASLKRAVLGRLDQLNDEIEGLRGELSAIRGQADAVSSQASELDNQSAILKTEYGEVRKRGASLLEDLKQSERLVSSCLERLVEAENGLEQVKENERVIRAIVEKSHLLNVNNSIIGARWSVSNRRELKPEDLVSVTENISQLLVQFEHAYRLVEDSSERIQKSLTAVSAELQEDLGTCLRLTDTDHAVIKAVRHSERLIEAGVEGTSALAAASKALHESASQLDRRLQTAQRKAKHLSQIGQASIELQAQLEVGFKGIVDQVGSITRPPNSSVSH